MIHWGSRLNLEKYQSEAKVGGGKPEIYNMYNWSQAFPAICHMKGLSKGVKMSPRRKNWGRTVGGI